jgi:hypothetical protein
VRLVIDTNLLISALLVQGSLPHGPCHRHRRLSQEQRPAGTQANNRQPLFFPHDEAL